MPAKKSTKTKKKMPKKASVKKVSTKKSAKASKPVAKKKISPKAKAKALATLTLLRFKL